MATFLYIKVHPGFFVFVLFCFVFLRGVGKWGEIALVPFSVHKSAMDLMALHWDPELGFFPFSRMSKLPSFEQCRQESDKRS